MRSFARNLVAVSAAAIALGVGSARACDVCGIYSAVQFESPQKNSIRFGLVEQFTDLRNVQRDGHYVENTDNQFLKNSFTQVVGSYDTSDSTSLQLVLPVIGRDYRRIQEGAPQDGSLFGIGDMALIANYVPVHYADGETVVRWRLFTGVELPTGDAHLLGEEAAPDHHEPEAPQHEEDSHEEGGDSHDNHDEHMSHKHGGVDHESGAENAIHGHDLALGSGSWDVPFGTGLTLQYGKYLSQTDVQYTIRTPGAYDYKYANDWVWATALGRFLYLTDDSQVSFRARLSGQYKGFDTGKGGLRYEDTAANTTFLGPELAALLNHTWLGVLGWDVPLNTNNSDLQMAPSWRLRAALTYRF